MSVALEHTAATWTGIEYLAKEIPQKNEKFESVCVCPFLRASLNTSWFIYEFVNQIIIIQLLYKSSDIIITWYE